MGIFRQFPYTNFHDLNLDWILNKIKELTNEWLTYNNNWNKWQTDTNNAFEELKSYVENYFENLNITIEISKLFDELKETGYFDSAISTIILDRTRINTQLKYSNFFPYSAEGITAGIPQGSCYAKNTIIIYLSSGSSNYGRLVYINPETFETIKIIDNIELKHGNTLTYNPDNECIYSTSLYNVGNITDILAEVRVLDISDMDNPVITEILNVPLPTGSVGIYALAYDPISKKFAGTCKSNPTGQFISGEMNRIVIYNNDLSAIEKTFITPDKLLSIGVACFYNNKIYTLIQQNCNLIACYNIDETVSNYFELPEFIENYRYIGEMESLIYNYDSDEWFVASLYSGSGVRGYAGLSLIKCGLYNKIPNIKRSPSTTNLIDRATISITVNNGSEGLPNNQNTWFPCLMDAINYSVINRLYPTITITGKSIGTVEIVNFNGNIFGPQAYIEWGGFVRLINSQIRFTYSRFTGAKQIAEKDTSIELLNSTIDGQLITFTNLIQATASKLFNMPADKFNILFRCIIIGQTPTSGQLIHSVALPYTPTP